MSYKDILPEIRSPFTEILDKETYSGVLLIACTLIALIWANSPWQEIYFSIWETPITFSIGSLSLAKPLFLWVNDGLMAVFFFFIGLEVKRELIHGELSTWQKASLSVFAAFGGMIIPAVIFLLLHSSKAGSEAWGIPVATDIAFALGILGILGKRVSLSMKVFLTAFAVADDIGAILLIAFFYSEGIYWPLLGVGAGLAFLLLVLNRFFNVMRIWPYILVGSILWLALLKGGLHPTIAGVLTAFSIPHKKRISVEHFKNRLRTFFQRFKFRTENQLDTFMSRQKMDKLDKLGAMTKNVQPPLQRLEHQLDNFVSYFVMPLFALANAGVALTGGWSILGEEMFIHIFLALFCGKAIGIFLFAFIAIKLKLASMPLDFNWLTLLGLSFFGGIGFTMSLFIANLALDTTSLLIQAKIGVLLASLCAALMGLTLLGFFRKKMKLSD